MGLLNAMVALAEEWDDVLSHLDTDQAARLRGLVARFLDESDPDASSEISEAIMPARYAEFVPERVRRGPGP